jgi:hypothetical protein
MAPEPGGHTRHRRSPTAWPWWAYLLVALVALAAYAVAVRHASALAGLLAAVGLSWAADQAERTGQVRCRARPAGRRWSSTLVLVTCIAVGLVVAIWPHILP